MKADNICSIEPHLSSIIKQKNSDEKLSAFLTLSDYAKKLVAENDCEVFRIICNADYPDGVIELIFHGQIEMFNAKNDFAKAVLTADGFNISQNPLGDDWIQITFFIKDMWK